MNSSNRLWKWLAVVVPIGLGLLAVYPPAETLKPGIDLAGGTSLIYEIDDSGLRDNEKVGLADRVINVIRKRVDPNNQFNIIWRPIGNDRIEIQMPRPPQDAKKRRDEYEAVRDEIREKNVSRADIERALALPEDGRAAELDALVRGVEGRSQKLEAVVTAWKAYSEARGGGDYEREVTAYKSYEDSLSEVTATNLTLDRLRDVLSLGGSVRDKELAKLKSEFPSYAELIDKNLKQYEAWISKRGSLEDPADLKRLLRGAGVLEFRILAERNVVNQMLEDPTDASLRQPASVYIDQLQKRGPRPKAGDRYAWFPLEDAASFMSVKSMEQFEARRQQSKQVVEPYAGKYYVLAYSVDRQNPIHGLTQQTPNWSLKRASPATDYATGRPIVQFELDAPGGQQFYNITRNNIGRQLAIFLDGNAMSQAVIEGAIGSRGQIRGDFTQDRVMELVRILEAGALPARIKETPLKEQNVGPTIGMHNRETGLRAAEYGLIAVAAFMLIYYLAAGILADIALLINLLLVLAAMAAMEATFTLPGIAGILLTVGMAVDANVLIYERIREELQRGVTLKKSIKIGYDKALSTIVDANLTTLITCVILGYVGSEEVKGFAMTLGFGIVISMYTALFVTRVILVSLVEIGLVKSLKMLHFFGRPNIDWISWRKLFWPGSLACVLIGLVYFGYVAETDKEALFDIEFLGGSSVQVELAQGIQMSAEDIRGAVTGNGGSWDGRSADVWLADASKALADAKIGKGASADEFTLTSDTLTANDLNVLLRTTFEDRLKLGGFEGTGHAATFSTKPLVVRAPTEDDPNATKEVPIDEDAFRRGVMEASRYVTAAAQRLRGARIQTVSDVGEATDKGNAFEVVTVEANKELVRAAILNTMGNRLKVERPINFVLYTDDERARDGYFPILTEHRVLGDVIGSEAPNDVLEYRGGVALVFDKLDPPQSVAAVDKRFKDMQLQPQFEQYDTRPYRIFGLKSAGSDEQGDTEYSRIALVVKDDSLLYSDDPMRWRESLAAPELRQAEEALSAEKSLRKVVQFAPQIATQTQHQAVISMVMALAAIVAYVWLRFGTMQYGLAAIIALIHDVSITLGLIALVDSFNIPGLELRIDLAMIAALLTVVGYSLNDTIVVFDRIREHRGRSGKLTSNLLNSSINSTLSRTVLTSTTTLIALLFLFVLGGPGVKGFSFALLVGVFVGTYSSIAIASPLLQNRRLLHSLCYIIAAAGAIGMALAIVGNMTFVIVVAVIVAILLLLLLNIERRVDATPVAA